jgi:hypothetical protein
MELEELKNIWKNSEPEFQPKDEEEIALMLKGRSMSIIDKLKRNVWIELLFTVVVSILLLIYASTLETGALKWTSISLLLLFIVYSFYYIKKLTLLNRFSGANENIRDNIAMLVKNLTDYLKFYKRSYAILYPVYFCLGILFSALERGTEKYIDFLSRPINLLSLLAIALLFFFTSTWLASWYLRKLYGDHLDKLKDLLNELQR